MNNERARSVTRRRGGRVHHGVRPERSRAGGVAPTRQLWAERTGRAQPPPAGERLAPRDATRRRRSAFLRSGPVRLSPFQTPFPPYPRRSLSLSLSLTRALPCRSLLPSLMPCRSALCPLLVFRRRLGWPGCPEKTAPKTGFLHDPLQQNRTPLLSEMLESK